MPNTDTILCRMDTERLVLRPWKESDADALFYLASDHDVSSFAGWTPHEDIEESRSVIRNIFSNGRTWAITLKGEDKVIGCICYYDCTDSNIGIGDDEAEIGYWIGKTYWNQGYATEALTSVVDWCFNRKGFISLWCDCFTGNDASRRVMEKCGFRDTGETNRCSNLYHEVDRPVHIMRLDYNM